MQFRNHIYVFIIILISLSGFLNSSLLVLDFDQLLCMKQNHKDVLVVVDSQDYSALLEFLQGNQDDQLFRRKLAWKAFQHVASYDSAVSEWLWKQTEGGISLLYIFLAIVN